MQTTDHTFVDMSENISFNRRIDSVVSHTNLCGTFKMSKSILSIWLCVIVLRISDGKLNSLSQKHFYEFCFIKIYAAHKHHKHGQQPIRVDHSGNCYIDSLHIQGRCMEYRNCWSAVHRWQMHGAAPLSCDTTAPNIICCTEAFSGIVGHMAAQPNFLSFPIQQSADFALQPERKSERGKFFEILNS